MPQGSSRVFISWWSHFSLIHRFLLKTTQQGTFASRGL